MEVHLGTCALNHSESTAGGKSAHSFRKLQKAEKEFTEELVSVLGCWDIGMRRSFEFIDRKVIFSVFEEKLNFFMAFGIANFKWFPGLYLVILGGKINYK